MKVANQLVPIEFHGATLLAVKRAEDGQVYVALTPFCEALGIDAQFQRRRIMKDEVLSDGVYQSSYPVTKRLSDGVYRSLYPVTNDSRATFFLRLDLVSGWLMSIRDNVGLGVSFSAASQIIDSDVSDNGGVGVTGSGKVVRTTVKGNGSDGIDLGNGSELSFVIDSDVSHNAANGITLVCPAIAYDDTVRSNGTANLATSGSPCLAYRNVTSP